MFASEITRLNTRVRCVVHRHDASPLTFEGAAEGGVPKAPGSVIGLSSQKSLSTVGNFSVTMKCPRTFDFEKEIQNGDWSVWWWEINGRAYHGSFGPIVNVGKGRIANDGADVVNFTVACADFARVIERTQVWFDDFSQYETNIGGARLGAAMGFTPTGSPDAVVENVINAFLGQSGVIGGAWKLPSTMSWIGQFFVQGLYLAASSTKAQAEPRVIGDKQPFITTAGGLVVLNPKTSVLRGEVNGPEIALFQPSPGTLLLQHLSPLSNDLLNEIYYDVMTEDDTLNAASTSEPLPCVFLRERPFVNADDGLRSPWFRIPAVKINRNEGLFNDTTSKSADERVNMILLYGTALGTGALDQYALNPPLYDREDIARNGICKLERQSPFVGFGVQQNGQPWSEELTTWHRLLASWYGLNHEWKAGSLMFRRAIPKARVGRRIILDDADEKERTQFYIENVSHQWQFPTGGQTTLGVTRGWRGTDESLVSAVVQRASRFQREARGGKGTVVIPAKLPSISDRIDP